jgi:outer membrane lipoprotein-sorting protein
MTRRILPLVLLALSLLVSGVVTAQSDPEAEALLNAVTERAAALEDASFLLTGRLIDPDGTEIALEIDVQTIPSERVASAYVLQPDALADNIIVLNGDTVANYTFLTHQVTLFDADDPDALGGLIGGGEEGALDVTFDLNRLFAGYRASLQGSTETPEGPAQRVRLDNVEEGAVIAWVEATIPDATRLPYRLAFHGSDDALLAELRFEDLRLDQGLAAADVTFLPEDAEILDERASAPSGE